MFFFGTPQTIGRFRGAPPPPLGTDYTTLSLTVAYSRYVATVLYYGDTIIMLADAKFWSFYCKTWYSEYSRWLPSVAFWQLYIECAKFVFAPPFPSLFKGLLRKAEERKGREGPAPYANSWICPCVNSISWRLDNTYRVAQKSKPPPIFQKKSH